MTGIEREAADREILFDHHDKGCFKPNPYAAAPEIPQFVSQ